MARKRRRPTRRAVLRMTGGVLSGLIATLSARPASAFRTASMPAADALAYRNRCKPDRFHAAGIEQAIGRLKAAGIDFDERRLRATLVCPICGCPVIG